MNATSNEVVTLPKGGGAQHGMGEKFSPDLHTDTGNFTVPIALPPGRNGFQPQLSLVYSNGSGNGNGPFGLGWNLSIPGVCRRTSKGIPRYDEAKDVLILSGAEDLVPVETLGTTTRYRPHTEGLFAEILYHRDATNSYWEVRSKDGSVSFYGTEALFGTDPATISDPSDRTNVFAWKLTRTEDTCGNRIEYEYERDSAEEGPHRWDQLYLKQIRYADHEDNSEIKFLVSVSFEYADRLELDPFSEYRSGFEIRTRKRCTRIVVRAHADIDRYVLSYDFVYLDQCPKPKAGLLVTTTAMSRYFPLSFGGQWDRKSFQRFPQAPSFNLEDPEVKLVDLDGDGVTDAIRSGSRLECFFNDPKAGWKGARWVERQTLELFPNVNLFDPRVTWADITGDALQDIALVYDGNVEYWPNLGHGKWGKRIHMQNSPRFPYGYDPKRILLGDVDSDGLADIVYIDNTKVTLWINQSGNRWSDPFNILGTPPVSVINAVRLVDLLGSGISGVLWSRDANGLSRDHFFFLDFTDVLKPWPQYRSVPWN